MRIALLILLIRAPCEAMRRALVVVDMTVEQVANISFQKDEMIQTIRHLALSGKFDTKIDSHLWFEKGGPPSSLAEMYPHVGRAGTPGAELIPELCDLGLDSCQYSCFAGGAELEILLRERGIEEVVITGINTDYCVMATALDSFYSMFRTRVVGSGISSFNGRAGHLEGLKDIRRFLGDIVVGADEYLGSDPAARPSLCIYKYIYFLTSSLSVLPFLRPLMDSASALGFVPSSHQLSCKVTIRE
ncbi:unnamed protein product [Durusdinium trenchii]|uniref:Isochorismatase-like domain-containing protein n=1 Tax=Durusdinium trenchii TaxID=1381693 RepID=A0ABP0HKL6_9DINO